MRCVHCDKTIRANQPTFVYAESKATAHVACVSQPSAAEMDRYLVAFHARPTRRVYSTGIAGTVTGRFRTSGSRAARPREG